MTAAPRPLSRITAAANAFVEAHLTQARELGRELGDLVDDPEAFLSALRAGFATLTDPVYRDGQRRIAPGLTDPIGVRLPLLTAVRRSFERTSKWASADSLLWLADRMLREPGLEIRMFAFRILIRVLPPDAERAWQVLRRAARDAHDWITVDELAHAYGAGILLEPRRWAEIEQLAFSSSPWERRLVGSTIATIPFVRHCEGRRPEIAERALPIAGNLIGDADPDVQKALAWALRSLALVDAAAVRSFIDEESTKAKTTNDGSRAWVLRDALPALAPNDAAAFRARLDGVRRRPGAASTSDASAMAAQFRGLVESTPRAAGPRTAVDFRTGASPDTTASPDPAGRTETRTGVTA